jgi:bifunctional pyridoxal-dependent enzyme with beta-cystathionase and maltose regulon repressor activities
MESYYSRHREERLEYQKERNSKLKKEISQYNKNYYEKHIGMERRNNRIVQNIHKLSERINDLTILAEDILNKHPVNSRYYKITRKNRTKKNAPTIDTFSIEFD